MNHLGWCDYYNALDNIKATRAKIYKNWVLEEAEYDEYHADLKLVEAYEEKKNAVI